MALVKGTLGKIDFRKDHLLPELVFHPGLIMQRAVKVRGHMLLQVDSNKFQYLPEGCLEYLRDLESIKLAKNPWHCDCSVLYVANWLRDNKRKVWDSNPKCRGPGDLGGRLLEDMTFNDLCEGQWASMVRLSPRIPIK